MIVVVGHRGLGNNEENIPKIEMTLTTDLTSAMTWMDGSNFLRSYDGSLGRIQSKGHQLRITEITLTMYCKSNSYTKSTFAAVKTNEQL